MLCSPRKHCCAITLEEDGDCEMWEPETAAGWSIGETPIVFVAVLGLPLLLLHTDENGLLPGLLLTIMRVLLFVLLV